MFFFSKSKYCEFCQCPKASWLHKYRPELLVRDEETLARFAAGIEIGNLAKGLFGAYIETTAYRPDGRLDLNRMKQRTRQYLAEKKDVIAEAAFDFCGLYCAVDLLRKTEGGYALYEVKSGTHVRNQAHIIDISYQKYVIERLGFSITDCYTVTVNPEYAEGEPIDLEKFFVVTNVTELVDAEIVNVAERLRRAEATLALKSEPAISPSVHCHSPYDCGFLGYCMQDISEPAAS